MIGIVLGVVDIRLRLVRYASRGWLTRHPSRPPVGLVDADYVRLNDGHGLEHPLPRLIPAPAGLSQLLDGFIQSLQGFVRFWSSSISTIMSVV